MLKITKIIDFIIILFVAYQIYYQTLFLLQEAHIVPPLPPAQRFLASKSMVEDKFVYDDRRMCKCDYFM